MSPSRQAHPAEGPERVPCYGHLYDALHKSILSDDAPDDAFMSKISNKAKVDYITQALRLDPAHFHLDLPLPLDDWQLSDDMSLISAGLYFSNLRRQFFARLMAQDPALEVTDVWTNHATAEYWNDAFNREFGKRSFGVLLPETRSLH